MLLLHRVVLQLRRVLRHQPQGHLPFQFQYPPFHGFVYAHDGVHRGVHHLDGGILKMLMPCVVMCIPFLWTYPLQRFVIYKNKREPADEEAEA